MSAYDSFGAPGGLDVRRLLSLVKPDVLGWIDDALASADIEGLRFTANIDGQTVRPLAVLVTPPEGYSFVDLNRYGITLREEIGVAATALRFSENGDVIAAQIALDVPSLGSQSRLVVQNSDTATFTETSVELTAYSASHAVTTTLMVVADTNPRIETSHKLVVSNTAPSIVLTDTTASAKDLTIKVDGNKAQLRESAAADGSLLVLDLANNRLGIGRASPGSPLSVTGNVDLESAADTILYITSSSSTSFHRGRVIYQRVNGSGAISNGWLIAGTDWAGFDGSNYYYSANLTALVDGTVSAGVMPIGFSFATGSNNSPTERVRFSAQGNTLLATASEPASAVGALVIKNGTAPTSSPADQFSLYSADAAAGKAWPWFRAEDGTHRAVLGVSGVSGVSSGNGTAKMNGTTSRNSAGWLTLHDHQGNTVYVPYWTTITG